MFNTYTPFRAPFIHIFVKDMQRLFIIIHRGKVER